jgi:hypothetical protein
LDLTGVHVLFPLGVRISTWLCLLAFAAIAIRRRDTRALFAGWVWLVTFEAAFDGSALAIDGWEADRVLPLVLGVFTVAWCAQTRPLDISFLWAAATVFAFVVWLAIGFPWNSHSGIGFRWDVEILNETVKTMWAFAFLIPLWAGTRKARPPRRMDGQQETCLVVEEDPEDQVGPATVPC